jgi:hypothetical protein
MVDRRCKIFYCKLHRIQQVVGSDIPCSQLNYYDEDLKGNTRLPQMHTDSSVRARGKHASGQKLQ